MLKSITRNSNTLPRETEREERKKEEKKERERERISDVPLKQSKKQNDSVFNEEGFRESARQRKLMWKRHCRV